MAAPLIFRGVPLLRVRLNHTTKLTVAASSLARRPCSTPAAEPIKPKPPPEEENLSTAAVVKNNSQSKYHSRSWVGDPEYRKWKDKEAEILLDVDPTIHLTKFILHSDRYMDGERLTAEDEKAVTERLLAYHPHADDKIGSGIDFIMVDRHPLFKRSRCLFVIRTDGGWIDFSYQKCLRAYIQHKYPSRRKVYQRTF